MASRLTLTLPPTVGSREVEVDRKRFSIGRTPENDLVVDDSSLSRRHALIEEFDGVFHVSDCGSSNGTLINGGDVAGAVELHDWDVLTFGGVGNIVVRLQDDSQTNNSPAQSTPAGAGSPVYPQYATPASPHGPASAPVGVGGPPSWLSPPVIAISAAVVILLVAGLVLLLTGAGSQGVTKPSVAKKRPTPVESNEPPLESGNTSTPIETPIASNTSEVVEPINSSGGPESDELSYIEASGSKLLSSISRDTRPVLTDKPLKEINAQIQRYRNSPSSLRESLRAMKQDIGAVSAAARANGLKPPLAVYATLARIDKDGGRGDPAQVAGQICPALNRMKRIFGDELANDSLLSVAGLEEGAILQGRITRLASRVNDSPTTIRTVWYLHDHQIISPETFNFVLRFIAIGIIAQNPQKFGIAAEPLTF
ncbi:MAG: FHA domain-containing protein [Pyrinomonadaceae bacterium]